MPGTSPGMTAPRGWTPSIDLNVDWTSGGSTFKPARQFFSDSGVMPDASWPGLSRPSTRFGWVHVRHAGVDARDEPGHDGPEGLETTPRSECRSDLGGSTFKRARLFFSHSGVMPDASGPGFFRPSMRFGWVHAQPGGVDARDEPGHDGPEGLDSVPRSECRLDLGRIDIQAGEAVLFTQRRQDRACPGHPRGSAGSTPDPEAWMPGTSPGMTALRSWKPRLDLNVDRTSGGDTGSRRSGASKKETALSALGERRRSA